MIRLKDEDSTASFEGMSPTLIPIVRAEVWRREMADRVQDGFT
jgi:hypothetical protein